MHEHEMPLNCMLPQITEPGPQVVLGSVLHSLLVVVFVVLNTPSEVTADHPPIVFQRLLSGDLCFSGVGGSWRSRRFEASELLGCSLGAPCALWGAPWLLFWSSGVLPGRSSEAALDFWGALGDVLGHSWSVSLGLWVGQVGPWGAFGRRQGVLRSLSEASQWGLGVLWGEVTRRQSHRTL